MLTLTLLVALPGALASSSSSKRTKKTTKTTSTRVTVETYPAMEDGEIVVPRQAKIPALEPAAVAKIGKSTKSSRRVQTLGAAAPISTPISAPAEFVTIANSTAPAKPYEVVPSEKRAQILQRMRLCQSLFEETGRAYDYRSMTTAQLQEELNAVRAGERPVAQIPADVNPNLFVPVNAAPTDSDPILDAQE